MPARTVFDGVLHGLYQTPPFRRLKQQIDGASPERLVVVHRFITNRISKELMGDNAKRAEEKVNAERGV